MLAMLNETFFCDFQTLWDKIPTSLVTKPEQIEDGHRNSLVVAHGSRFVAFFSL